MIYGVAWYPEHWPESRWPEDLTLMREAGVNMVRIIDFAWSTVEPRSGEFEFDLFERAINLAGEYGMQVIIATPTASPPAWLTAAHPDVLAVSQDGVRYPHGGRCHYNVSSATYRRYARRVAEELAQHFAANPHVIAWQIDNEYNRVSYDEETRSEFQVWLQRKYTTLDELNRRWWTGYWSETYSEWTQLPLPVFPSTEHHWMVHNPGLRLDFRRFVTHQYASYQREQIDAMRPYARSEQKFTHNFMGWFDAYDHYVLSEDLDVAGFDNYIGEGHLDYASNGAAHDLTRGFKRQNYWVLETQAGYTNHMPVNNTLDKGEIRSLVFHQVGHGADLVAYWQWRSALGGQEQYWGNVLHPDGTPRPHYAEIQQIGRELAQLTPVLAGTSPAPDVALLHAYEDRWAINFQRHHAQFDPVEHLLSFYRPWREAGVDVDIVHPLSPLESYRVVIAPHLHLLTPELTRHLTAYVESGGHLVLGPRSGMKDEDNALLPSRQPGDLHELAGAVVEQFYPLDVPVAIDGALGAGQAVIWAERLAVDAAATEVLARYAKSNGWLDGQAAITTRPVGKGRVTMVGAWLDPTLAGRLVAHVKQVSSVHAPMDVPIGVEVCRRAGPEGEVLLVINHTREGQTLTLPAEHRELLTRRTLKGRVELAPRDVLVLSALNVGTEVRDVVASLSGQSA